MASSGGHWNTLAEAQKLTQSYKIPGVIEEDIKRNNPLLRIPVAQAAGTGLKIEWLRENTLTEDAVAFAGIGQQLVWGEDVTYTEVESTLRYMYIQRKLDRYVQNIYGTYNDYKAQVLMESEKGTIRKVGDKLVYGDETYGGSPTEFDGYHALAAERGTPWTTSATGNSRKNMDGETGALSLLDLRNLLDDMKAGVSELLVPGPIGIRLDAAYEEKGFVALKSATAGSLSLLTRGIDSIGMPILYFAGVPITRTDYLVEEEDGTGTGGTSNKRAKKTSTAGWSLFAVRYGNVINKEPGISYAFGGTEGAGDFYELWTWERLENYNAGGMRMDTYGSVLLGSTHGLGRIFDITDAAIVV